jgi:hypothetical protein
MNAKEFVDSLFEGYEETAALADFKEELLANLNAKIESLAKKGMDAQAAFEKASAELGDVSAFADELSLKKRTEVFEEVYMDIRQYMPGSRVAGYVTFGAIALFGIIVASIALIVTKTIGVNFDPDIIAELNLELGKIGELKFDLNKTAGLNFRLGWAAFWGTLLPFLTAAAIGFTYLGVTQETASVYPASKKRGAWYAAAAGLIVFGLIIMAIVYFGSRFAVDIVNEQLGFDYESLVPLFGVLIPFVLPGIGILVYMVLTEKDRLKPWAKSFQNTAVKNEIAMWNNPATATRFGMFSGAIWIFATGIFLLLGFLIRFKYSWLVFIFATAFQLLIQAAMSKQSGR